MAIAENMASMQEKMARAMRDAGRTDSVTLIAVSKTQTIDTIRSAIDAGHFVFGENRVMEAIEKFTPLRAHYPALQLHGIGPLQTNKVDDAVAIFDVLHTIDRLKLIEKCASAMQAQNKWPDCFLQVNTGAEPQKAGALVGDVPALVAACRAAGLRLVGLMCIPPHDAHPAPHFALLQKLARDFSLAQLSMGMSGDFETAIALGATHIRVGSALFGARE